MIQLMEFWQVNDHSLTIQIKQNLDFFCRIGVIVFFSSSYHTLTNLKPLTIVVHYKWESKDFRFGLPSKLIQISRISYLKCINKGFASNLARNILRKWKDPGWIISGKHLGTLLCHFHLSNRFIPIECITWHDWLPVVNSLGVTCLYEDGPETY